MSNYRIADQDYPAQLKTIWETSLSILKDPIAAASSLSLGRAYHWPHYVLIVALSVVLSALIAILTPELAVGIVYLIASAAVSVALQLYIGPWVLQKVIGVFGKNWSLDDARYYNFLFQGIGLLFLPLALLGAVLGSGVAVIITFAIFGLSVLFIVQGLRFGTNYTGLGYGKLILLLLVYGLVMVIPSVILQSLLGVTAIPA